MSDKCALVTGSVSGIGRALAKELASRGYDLIICSAGERLDAASDGLRQTGVQVSAAKADLVTRIVTGYRGVIRRFREVAAVVHARETAGISADRYKAAVSGAESSATTYFEISLNEAQNPSLIQTDTTE